MPRTISAFRTLTITALVVTPVFAQSVTMTVQSGNGVTAVQATSADDIAEARQLAKEGDKSMTQKRYEVAIALFERAYRLAPNEQSHYARLLNARRAAGRLSAEDREALDLIEKQQATRVQQTLTDVRISLAQARAALHDGDTALARSKADSASMTLDNLPPNVDVSIYRQQIKATLNSIRRADRKTGNKSRQVDQTLTLGDAGEMTPVDTNAPASTTPAASTPIPYTPPTNPEPANSADLADTQTPEMYDNDQHVYDRSVEAALLQSRADVLMRSGGEDMIPPTTDLTYPSDFANKTQRRARYRDGVLYESQSFTGADGQTYTTAIYDISDLVVSVPDFYAPYPATAREQRQWELDRQFIRDRSYIFNGYPEDLAAGLPLLHFFGGINQNAIGGRTDPNQRARVLRTIELFLNQQTGGGLAPVQQPQGLQPGIMQAN